MKFIQYYLDCLSHASYLIADETTGRAVVVDPQRDVAEYLADSEETGPHDRARHRDALPRRLPVGPPGTGQGHRREDRVPSVAETEFEFAMGVADGEHVFAG